MKVQSKYDKQQRKNQPYNKNYKGHNYNENKPRADSQNN